MQWECFTYICSCGSTNDVRFDFTHENTIMHKCYCGLTIKVSRSVTYIIESAQQKEREIPNA